MSGWLSRLSALLAGSLAVACGGHEQTGAAGSASPSVGSGGDIQRDVDGAPGRGGTAGDQSRVADASVVDDIEIPPLDAGAVDRDAGLLLLDADPHPCKRACNAGDYCDLSIGACTACSIATRFHFAQPVKLLAPSSGPGRAQIFPRQATRASFSGLLYGFDGVASGSDIAFSSGTTLSEWQQATPLSLPLGNRPFEAAPLPMPDPIDFRFFYDTQVLGRRMVYTASEVTAGWQSAPFEAFEALNSAGDNYHVAAQTELYGHQSPPQITRLYWTTNRDDMGGSQGVAHLVTSPGGPTVLEVPIKLPAGCPTSEPDLHPWLTPDGGLLLISSREYAGQQCTPSDDGRRLYGVWVDFQTGQSISSEPTIDLSYLHSPGFDDEGPSLTRDMCTLLFASDRGRHGDFDIYAATRD